MSELLLLSVEFKYYFGAFVITQFYSFISQSKEKRYSLFLKVYLKIKASEMFFRVNALFKIQTKQIYPNINLNLS